MNTCKHAKSWSVFGRLCKGVFDFLVNMSNTHYSRISTLDSMGQMTGLLPGNHTIMWQSVLNLCCLRLNTDGSLSSKLVQFMIVCHIDSQSEWQGQNREKVQHTLLYRLGCGVQFHMQTDSFTLLPQDMCLTVMLCDAFGAWPGPLRNSTQCRRKAVDMIAQLAVANQQICLIIRTTTNSAR